MTIKRFVANIVLNLLNDKTVLVEPMNNHSKNETKDKDSFLLKARKNGGGTSALKYWGSACEYDTLTDVLLGPIENFKWLKTSSVSKKLPRNNILRWYPLMRALV